MSVAALDGIIARLPDPLPVPVKEGQRGAWRIETFDLTEDHVAMSNIRHYVRGEYSHLIKPGTYTRLVHDSTLVMSNTSMEVITNQGFIRRARGRVLINGLGLGMALRAVLDKDEVKHVIVQELDLDVITLVGPGFEKDISAGRLTIRHGDAFTYKPTRGETYDCAWHDVWDSISDDNLKEMWRLTRKWSRRVPMQMCWARDLCERMR